MTVTLTADLMLHDVLRCDWTAWVTCHGWYMLTVWMLTAGALVLEAGVVMSAALVKLITSMSLQHHRSHRSTSSTSTLVVVVQEH